MNLFEKPLGEHGQIDAPITPEVPAVVLEILVFVAFLVEVSAQFRIVFIEKVLVSDGYPVELGRACEQFIHLACKPCACYSIFIERFSRIFFAYAYGS